MPEVTAEMTVPEVQFVLDAIKEYAAEYAAQYGSVPYGAGLSDVPLERVDRDNSEVLEGPLHQHSDSLEGMNKVGATLVDRSTSPVGTAYNHAIETVVGVRVEGAHVQEYGAIDPQNGTADETAREYPTISWDVLTAAIRRAVLTERQFPQVQRDNTGYKDLFVANETDSSDNYADYYRYDFDVVFSGFEDLP